MLPAPVRSYRPPPRFPRRHPLEPRWHASRQWPLLRADGPRDQPLGHHALGHREQCRHQGVDDIQWVRRADAAQSL